MTIDRDDVLHIEAQELMRQATDEMLELASLQEIDLNVLAQYELRGRRRQIGAVYIRNLTRELES